MSTSKVKKLPREFYEKTLYQLQGELVTMLSDPEGTILRTPTNVSWGGPDLCDLYIGSVVSDYVVHVRSPIPGMPLVHQR